MTKFSGSDWLKKNDYAKNISPLGELVADILGQTWQGIYHIDDFLPKVDWRNDRFIEIKMRHHLATFDFSHLTVLIVLCFDNMLRLEIGPINPQMISLTFSRRQSRDGNMSTRLPELNGFITQVRESYSLKSR